MLLCVFLDTGLLCWVLNKSAKLHFVWTSAWGLRIRHDDQAAASALFGESGRYWWSMLVVFTNERTVVFPAKTHDVFWTRSCRLWIAQAVCPLCTKFLQCLHVTWRHGFFWVNRMARSNFAGTQAHGLCSKPWCWNASSDSANNVFLLLVSSFCARWFVKIAHLPGFTISILLPILGKQRLRTFFRGEFLHFWLRGFYKYAMELSSVGASDLLRFLCQSRQ